MWISPLPSDVSRRGLATSELAANAVQSEIRAMTVECDRLQGINLAQGVCDTGVPHPVAEAALAAIRDGFNIYTRLDGIAPLRAAIARKLAAHNGIQADPERGVLVTSGATGAFHAACLALLNPGDEVILFEPFYGYHRSTLASQRVTSVTVPLSPPDWSVDFDRLRHAIGPKTRAIVVNTPSNPLGKVFTKTELEAIAALAEETDLFVLTDEIYEYFVCDGAQHISFASLPGMAERTITVSGFSKTFIMADISDLPGSDAREKARWLLAKTGVAAVAGTAFFTGGRGENLLRFCYAKQSGALAEACQRLRAL
jgi:aminotransferase